MITIQTSIEVSTAAFGNLVINAIEGGVQGIGGWAQVESYKPSRWMPNLDSDDLDVNIFESAEVPEDFVFVRILECDENEEWDWDAPDATERTFELTPALLASGLALFLRAHARSETVDEYDASDADLVVQYACFGEQRYG